MVERKREAYKNIVGSAFQFSKAFPSKYNVFRGTFKMVNGFEKKKKKKQFQNVVRARRWITFRTPHAQAPAWAER